jgi:hypothetical protein
MNRGLLVFAVLLIIIGAAFNVIQALIIGLFLLFPAVLTTPRPRTQRIPSSQAPSTRRIAPRPPPVIEPPVMQAPPDLAVPMVAAASQVRQQPTFSPALFPNPIFPTLSKLPAATGVPSKESNERPTEQRDELLEFGALIALLRLAFG